MVDSELVLGFLCNQGAKVTKILNQKQKSKRLKTQLISMKNYPMQRFQ